MDIRCRKTNCKYNKDLTCLAKKLSISEKLVCLEYKNEKDKGIKDFSQLIFTSTPPKVADYRHLKDICLSCKAKCLFNNNTRCMSNGITVNSALSDHPKCMTFIKP